MKHVNKRYHDTFRELKCCVLIPTYNNEKTLAQVILDVLDYTADIIVVNDGSTDSTSRILERFSDLEKISYQKNKGKGHALKTGFKAALEKGYKYAITIDSDGQHYAQDLPRFLERLAEKPGALLVGARNMDQDSVPGKSSFGHKFSNFWFKFETGKELADTQSGYRLYPLEKLKEIKLVTQKFEFEIEVIVKAAWRGIEVESVPVSVYYAPREERVSHFRPFRDFTRISILNTYLVTIMLLWVKPLQLFRSLKKKNLKTLIREAIVNSNDSNRKIALAVALGIFMGIVPLWGYQMLIAVALAVPFKLNKAIVLISSNISIPPMIPLILFASFKLGGVMLQRESADLLYSNGISFEIIKNDLLQYIVGSVSLAVVMAIICGLISFGMLSVMRKKGRLQ